VTSYLVLLRGINVGGKNKLPMAQLRQLLVDLGYSDVSTYIASGNVLLRSDRSAPEIKERIEEALPRTFRLDSDLVAVLVLTHADLRSVVDGRPKGFGELDEAHTEGQQLVRALDPELVWLTHAHEPWRPTTSTA
jgi:uncharacterized protein (DUF1697 family)